MKKIRALAVAVIALVTVSLPSVAPSQDLIANSRTISFDRADFYRQLEKITDYPVILPNSLPWVHSKAYIIIDQRSGQVLTEQNSDQVLPIASMTKIITALTAVRLFDLEEVVTVSPTAAAMIGSTMWLKDGERVTIKTLLQGLLISSGNDAAQALAEHHSKQEGNIESFIAEMNRTARDLGLSLAQFRDPSGLSDKKSQSTAFDVALAVLALVENETLREIVGQASAVVSSADGSYERKVVNTNRLVNPENHLFLPGTIGGKTGFTLEAGHCLAIVGDYNGRRLAAVVINASNFTSTAAAMEIRKMVNWAKSQVSYQSYRGT